MPALGLTLAAGWATLAEAGHEAMPSSQPHQPTAAPATRLGTPRPPAEVEEGPFASATLLSESGALVPGSIATLAVHFTIADGWHTYWNGRSDTGFPFKAEWTLPSGFEIAGPLQWPPPKRYISPGDILDHVYETQVAILVPVRVPADARPGDRVKISADLTWLVCKSACVFEQGAVSIELPIAQPGTPAAPSGDASIFAATRARLPLPIEKAGGGISARIEGTRLMIDAPSAGRLEFYPLAACVETPSLLRDGAADGSHLSVGLGDVADSEGNARRVQGVVMIRDRAPAAPASPASSKPVTAPADAGLGAARFYLVDLAMPDSPK